MVTFNDLLSWDGTNLDTAGDALIAASHKYEQVNADLQKKDLGDGLSGKTFEAEAKARRILADDAEDLWTGLSKAGNDLKDASETVNTIKNSASSTQSSVSAAGLEIKDDNTVAVKDQQSGASASTSITSYQNEVDRLVEQARDTVTFISSVYDEIVKLDDTANGPSPEVVNHGERPPNPKWTPSQVNDWWTSLTKAQQENIIHKHPAWIGNLDGIPSNERHQANLIWLPITQAEIDKSVKDYEPKLTRDGIVTPGYKEMLQRQKDIHALSAMFLDSRGKPKSLDKEGMPAPVNGRTLLVLDNSGDHFRAAIASGDVDNADHVVVSTPGMDSTVDNGLAKSNGDPAKYVNGTENIMTESGLGWSTTENKDQEKGQETVAGVTWLGYDAPHTEKVFSSGEAKEGGKHMADFYDGLQETHHGDPHLMAAGHSYGSLTTGYALRQSTAPDDFSIMGSPGPSSVDASEFHMLPDHTFAAANNWDPIAASGYYGGNPTTNPNSDFTALDTDANGPYKYSSGHSHYTDKGSTSLHSQGQILKGVKPDYVDRPSIKHG
ncbi:hypothetical protein E4J66_06885 [Actinomyces viscosus]|uniref:Alpha/beta hydrolase of uncharacterized function (DUF1023) n=1 Tax=Actinomyces viscosus TaxID=1656 RepID=A0A3S4VKJ9_ACTVI|nr:alpha/beta hydrolase [Actinomyces viscosus]TFH52653.1 hypothetical protein E4J66_06885 [Actinomyces viscosus]VEI16872.1 Alpha/beta hydrolase of uncharacterised function (DUF1023) [Actinomyces viscosus]